MISAATLFASEVLILLTMALAAEIGFRAGRRASERVDGAVLPQVNVARGAAFAILGLLAAFTMSMAETRFSARRALILDEANAIQTTYLRSQYLEEPHPEQLRPLFVDYVDSRVAFYETGSDEKATLEQEKLAVDLQRRMWAHTIDVVRNDPTHGDTNSEFVESLNEMIDLGTARSMALYAHVPRTIVGLVVLCGVFAVGATGYSAGLASKRVPLVLVGLPLLVGISLGVIVDLDSPRIGFIQPGQRAMLNLQEWMHDQAPGEQSARLE